MTTPEMKHTYRESARPRVSPPNPLLVPRGFRWPKRCLKCAGQAKLREGTHSLDNAPVWLAAIVPVGGLLVFLVLRSVLRKSAAVKFSLCAPCEAAWRDARSAESVAVVGCAIGGVGITTAFFNGAWLATAGLVIATTLGIVAIRRRFVVGRTIGLAGVRDGSLLLSGVCPEMARRVQSQLDDGAAPELED